MRASRCLPAPVLAALRVPAFAQSPAKPIRMIVPYAAGGTIDVREKIAQAGSDPVGGTPDELAKFLAAGIAKWARVTREAGIRPQ